MKLEWTESAVTDREAIYDFIEDDNPRAAKALDLRFKELSARLRRFPRMGRPGRVEGTREMVALSNYILVYEVDGKTLRILRVLHAARQWPADE